MNKDKTVREVQLFFKPVLIGLVSLGIILYSVPVIWSSWFSIQEKWGTMQTLAIKAEKAQAKQLLLSNTKESELDDLLSRSEKALPKDKDAGGILAALQKARAAVGIEIRSIALSPGVVSSESAQTEDSVQRFSVTVYGPIDTLFSFITYITNARRILSVTGVGISFFAEGNVLATVELVAPYFPDPKVETTIDASLSEFSAAERNILQKIDSLPYISDSQTVSGSESFFLRDNYFGL